MNPILMEPYFYIKKCNNIHYLIHIIIDEKNYIEKISGNVYSSLMFHGFIKDRKEIVLIYEIDPFKELNNVTCIKHKNNELDFIYDKKELELIFPDLVKNTFNDKLETILYDYQNGGYYFEKTIMFNKLLNLNIGVQNFPINNVGYFACPKSFQ